LNKTIIKISCALIMSFAFFYFADFKISAAADINQQILDLRAQVEALTKQADQYKKNINDKSKEADTLAKQIDILNNQILKLTTQISITQDQISASKIEIADLENRIFDAQDQIIKQQAAIGKLILLIDERDKTSIVAVLLKNPTLANFSDQIQHDKDLNIQLNGLLVEVKAEKEQLQSQKTELEDKKKGLESLNSQQVQQKNLVQNTKTTKDQLLKVTKGKEAEYQKLLSEVEKKEAAFYEDLKKLEAEAVKSGAYIVHITAVSIPAKNKWLINWPEDDFHITQGYGMTAYAKRGAYGGAPHNGVDLANGTGTPVHPVFDGKILASGFNDGFGNWVAIVHNNNLVSIYGHFDTPSGLANGTAVTNDSIIGYEGSTGNATGAHVHLSIYKDFFTYINPKNGQLYFNYFDGTLNPMNYLP